MLQETLQPAALPLLAAKPAPPRGRDEITDLAALHTLYAPRLYRFLLLSTRDRDLAESLTQDTFLKLWKTRESFRGDCALYTWITRIAVSLLRSHTRTETFRFWHRAEANTIDVTDLAHQLPADGRSPEAILIARQSLAQVWNSVDQLSQRQRAVFLLRYVEEMELPDIAAALNLPLPTIKTHLYRALERIRAAHSPQGAKRS